MPQLTWINADEAFSEFGLTGKQLAGLHTDGKVRVKGTGKLDRRWHYMYAREDIEQIYADLAVALLKKTARGR